MRLISEVGDMSSSKGLKKLHNVLISLTEEEKGRLDNNALSKLTEETRSFAATGGVGNLGPQASRIGLFLLGFSLLFFLVENYLFSILDTFGTWNFLAFLFFQTIHMASWALGVNRDKEAVRHTRTILSTASVGGITAVSILLPASLVAINSEQQISNADMSMILYGINWFFLSLVSGVAFVFLVPLRMESDPLDNRWIGSFFGSQLIAIFIGMVNLQMGFNGVF